MGYIRTALKKKQEQLNRVKAQVARRPIKKATPEQEKGIKKLRIIRKSFDKKKLQKK